MKLKITKIAAGLLLAITATGAQAISIASLTIEEIGGVAGMSMSSATAGIGGGIYYNNGPEPGNGVNVMGSKKWTSTGSTDGAMITNGVAQGNGAFAAPFTYGGSSSLFNVYLNTSGGGVTANWTGADGANQITIDLSGFGWYWEASGLNHTLAPDLGTLVSDVQTIGNTTYYTLDWSHMVTSQEDPDFAGSRMDMHMEGVMRPVPEASTYGMMLAGLGLVGFMARRKTVAASTT